jgi:hypothetical protein
VIVTMVVIMIVAVRAMYVTVSDFLFRSFTDRDHFHVKVQVLTCQHVVTINHNVLVFPLQ